MQLLVRVKPATAERLRDLAAKADLTAGQWFDRCLAAAGGALVAHKLAILQKDLQERRKLSLQTARDLRKEDPARAAHFDSLADGLKDALQMVTETLEDR